ncbi:phosphate ABC transporter substrate-binding protein [Vibrio navarrensis]
MKNTILLLSVLLALSSPVHSAPVVIGHLTGVDQLSAGEAKRLFLGKLKQLPNGLEPIIIEYPDGAPMRSEFHDKVTSKTESQLQAYWAKLVFTGKATPPKTVDSAAAVIAEVVSTPTAIGYIDASDVTDQVKVIYVP